MPTLGLIAETALLSAGPGDSRKTLSVISALSQDNILEIRNFMQSLDPRELNWQSFIAEMTSFGYNATEPHGISFSLSSPRIDDTIPPPCSVLYLNLLRIYKESLANVVKHAAARNVTVGMDVGANRVTLVVGDDGLGLPEAPRKGRGLSNMRARAMELGGTFSLTTGNGTLIRVDIPIPVKYLTEGMGIECQG